MKQDFAISNLTHGQTNAVWKIIGKQMGTKDSQEVFKKMTSGEWVVSEKLNDDFSWMTRTFTFEIDNYIYTANLDEKLKIVDENIIFHPKFGVGKAYWDSGQIFVDYTIEANPYRRKHEKIKQEEPGISLYRLPTYNPFLYQLVVIYTTNPAFNSKG